MKLIDTHAHVEEIRDIEAALSRARQNGVRAIVGVGSDFVSNQKILSLSTQHPNFILPALGLHPWRLDRENVENALSFIENNLGRCLAIGEVGLDFAIPTPREDQEKVLQKILAIASRGKKPVLLHARRAWGEVLEQLEIFGIEKAVFHWFSGPLDVLKRILDRGYFISATPAAGYSNRHRQALKEAPLRQILLETDAPEEYQGKVSEPKDLILSWQAVCELKGKKGEEVAATIWENSLEVFGLDPEKNYGDSDDLNPRPC
ncbi:MAG: hydrolase, TatD family [Deltaproteobacteria bacterium]|nr:hydrolase, TatD family [Deltaproteobacteria bacterium]MBP1716925.1 hydrolase, TatD family [Deltaproteobacteria bacterium]